MEFLGDIQISSGLSHTVVVHCQHSQGDYSLWELNMGSKFERDHRGRDEIATYFLVCGHRGNSLSESATAGYGNDGKERETYSVWK
jgi:hypothetical protein